MNNNIWWIDGINNKKWIEKKQIELKKCLDENGEILYSDILNVLGLNEKAKYIRSKGIDFAWMTNPSMEIAECYSIKSEIIFRKCTSNELAKVLNTLGGIESWFNIDIEQRDTTGVYDVFVSFTMASNELSDIPEMTKTSEEIIYARLEQSGIIKKHGKWIIK